MDIVQRAPAPSPAVLDTGVVDEAPTPYALRPVRPWAQWATRAAVWGAIGVGCVGAVVGLVRPAPPAAPVAAAGDDDEAVPATVANYAELAVETWLTATEDDEARLDELFVEPLDLTGLGVEGRVVARVATVGGSRLQEGYWKVTVAADVVDPPPEGTDGEAGTGEVEAPEPARWYVEVGIVGDAAGGLLAVDAPALMPARSVDTDGLRLVGPELEPVVDEDPVAATLQGFFAAFLTGNGDLSRYLAEGVRGAPVSPAPFVTATVERMAVESVADDRLLVRAEVRATTRGGAQQLLGYELQARLSASGRWEIGHAAGAPSLVHDPADPAADADPDAGAGAGAGESGTTVSSVPGGAGTGDTPTSSTAPTTTADEPGM